MENEIQEKIKEKEFKAFKLQIVQLRQALKSRRKKRISQEEVRCVKRWSKTLARIMNQYVETMPQDYPPLYHPRYDKKLLIEARLRYLGF